MGSANELIITEELIKKIKANDQKVLLEFYEFSFSNLMQSVVRYKSNRSDQILLVNNAFMKIISNIHKFQIGSNYKAWSKKIIQNEIIDDFRKNQRHARLDFTESIEKDVDSTVSVNFDLEIEETRVLVLLNQLPPATRLVFNLLALEDMKPREICSELKLSPETVKWHLSEARKKLKLALEKEQYYYHERERK